VDATWPQSKRTTLEKRSGEGDVDSRIQVEGWRKMEAAAENRAEDGKEWSVAHRLEATRLKSSHFIAKTKRSNR